MTKEQLNQPIAIRDGAPEGATHVEIFTQIKQSPYYYRRDFKNWCNKFVYDWWDKSNQQWLNATMPTGFIRSLDDIKELIRLMQENEKQRKELRIKTEFLHNFVKVCKSGNVIATSTNAQKQLSDMFKQYTDDIEALEQLKQPACDNLSNDSDREVME